MYGYIYMSIVLTVNFLVLQHIANVDDTMYIASYTVTKLIWLG